MGTKYIFALIMGIGLLFFNGCTQKPYTVVTPYSLKNVNGSFRESIAKNHTLIILNEEKYQTTLLEEYDNYENKFKVLNFFDHYCRSIQGKSILGRKSTLYVKKCLHYMPCYSYTMIDDLYKEQISQEKRFRKGYFYCESKTDSFEVNYKKPNYMITHEKPQKSLINSNEGIK